MEKAPLVGIAVAEGITTIADAVAAVAADEASATATALAKALTKVVEAVVADAVAATPDRPAKRPFNTGDTALPGHPLVTIPCISDHGSSRLFDALTRAR